MPIATIDPTTGRTVRTFEPHGPAEIERRDGGRSERANEELPTIDRSSSRHFS